MRRFYFGWALATASALSLLTTVGRADDPPKPDTPPGPAGAPAAPGVPADAPVSLAFQYTIGRVQRFRAETKADLALELGGGGLGTMPMGMKMAIVYQEKVAGTHQGTATITAKVDAMSLSLDAMGTTFGVQTKNGKTTVTAPNGQNALGTSQGDAIRKSMKNLIGGGTTTFHRDAFGTETGGASASSQLGIGQLPGLLPDHPVHVGDTWDRKEKVRPPNPGGGGAGLGGQAAPPEIDLQMTYTLKSIETKAGKQFALIESSGSGATPADAPGMSVNENLTGITRFDIARGVVVSGKYNMDLSYKLQLPALGALAGGNQQGGGNPAPGLRIDGTIAATISETPAVPAGKAMSTHHRAPGG